MLFNSFAYAIFLPIVFLSYWLLPHNCRWMLLLVSSYYFYMSWNAKYVILIATTTLVSYGCGLALERTKDRKKKRLYVFLSLFIALGILYLFKYFNFSMDLLAHFKNGKPPLHLDYLLPVGISFYTFQSVGYIIDVYRGTVPAERNLGIYATFVAFFPQLVAGPIERTGNLLPQIRREVSFDYDNATYGTRLILWGLYKKMVIADNLAVWVDLVYGDVYAFKGGALLLASLFFSLQIYCDFSGYSDIARGSAKLLGIDLMENFKSPYFSASIREFWSRWHISLSTWFRDYVYIPLGGNRVSQPRNIINYLLTFLVSGLWHGASLHFVLWGGLHGCGQVCENLVHIKTPTRRGLQWMVRVTLVFLFVSLAWIYFRADNIGAANYVTAHLSDGLSHPFNYLMSGFATLEISRSTGIKMLFLYFLPLLIYDYKSLSMDVCAWLGQRHFVIRYGFILIMIVGILVLGYAGQSSFVYFQF